MENGSAKVTVAVWSEERLHQGGAELLDRPGTKWIDVQHPDEATLAMLAKQFGLHKLALEDCLHLDQRPKLEEYPGHHFIVLQTFTSLSAGEPVLQEMHFFLGHDWVISVHDGRNRAIEEIRARIQDEAAATVGRGPDFVVYLIADALVDQNFPLLDAFADELETLETSVFESPSKEQLQRAFELKRQLVLVRRVLSPQREVMALLARRSGELVGERTALYFRDVYDHLSRVYEQIEATRDMLGNVMEAYLSMVANRTNEISKQLTIFASIFLPLSFITGFFGQNFEELGHDAFLIVMLVLVFSLPVGMLLWFRTRNWL